MIPSNDTEDASSTRVDVLKIIVLCCLLLGAVGIFLVSSLWGAGDDQPGILTRAAENPEVLPWYWTATNVCGLACDRTEYLCYVDVQATFVDMGLMDTGRRTLSPVMAYAPTRSFPWQCPRGTIVEMSAEELTEERAKLDRQDEAAREHRARTERARALTQP